MAQKALALSAMPEGASPLEWLAAGPWCFVGREEMFPDWETSFTFAPEPLENAGLLPGAARAAQDLAARAIPFLARELAPGVSLPDRYWQLLLGPWAITLASQIVERSLRCEAMRQAWQRERLVVPLAPVEMQFNFVDENDFNLRGCLGEAYNFWLLSRLLELKWPLNWQKRIVDVQIATPPAARADWRGKAREFLRKSLLSLPFPRLKGMSALQALLFSCALAHKCREKDHSLALSAFMDDAALASIPLPDDPFPFFRLALPRSIRELVHSDIKKGHVDRTRIASVAAYENASYRQRLARWHARGGRLGFVQHGGNYGQERVVCSTEFVEYSQDAFFSWGWDSHGVARGKFIPLPYAQLDRIANKWRPKDDTLVFVGAEMAVYGYRLDSRPTPLQFVAYRKAKADFLSALPPEAFSQTIYRPYFALPGLLKDGEWIKARFPTIEILRGPLQPNILRCRLLVMDHHGTVMLEALAANTPMILYWDRASWPLTDECERLLDKLAAAGIWHPSPKDAARKAAEIWPDTRDWWQSDTVQAARLAYCEKQARTVPAGLNLKWIRTLRRL